MNCSPICGGVTVFSTLDLASAYHKMLLHPDSRDITAFITHKGLFRFCCVPLGLASAPSAFQKMMSTILSGLPGVQAYLEVIICYGTTQQDHDANLRRVLHALNEAGLKLNMHKCKFNQASLSFLGHTISKDGLHPDKDRVSAVAQAPVPHDTCSLRSLLGLASWYSKFIPDFATIVEPLRVTLKDSTDLKFTWTAEAESSFAEIKRPILEGPALALYDAELPTQVTTDVSDYGLGLYSLISTQTTQRELLPLLPGHFRLLKESTLLLNVKLLHVFGRWRSGEPTCGDATSCFVLTTKHLHLSLHPKVLVALD